LDLYHPSQLRSQARSRKRELYAMKQGLEAHDLQSWEDVTLLPSSACSSLPVCRVSDGPTTCGNAER
ncbi:MAG: hypothetical protein ABSB56_06430, partial [Nitrososphaerales archaeon]